MEIEQEPIAKGEKLNADKIYTESVPQSPILSSNGTFLY
jgi:hypothetical protein